MYLSCVYVDTTKARVLGNEGPEHERLCNLGREVLTQWSVGSSVVRDAGTIFVNVLVDQVQLLLCDLLRVGILPPS